MKNIYINITIVLAALLFGCEERPEYAELEGPFASFYPNTIAEFDEKVPQTVTVFIEATGVIRNTSFAYVTIPSDGSIITDPPYDPFTKELAIEIKQGGSSDGSDLRYGGSFELSYKNNATTQKSAIFNLTIDRTDGDLAAAASKVFYMKVKDDEFRIAVDSTVVFTAPSIENFNSEGEDESFCDAEITAPRGWTPYSLGSEFSWGCTFDGRGSSGNDGDFAMEMNNFNSPDGEAANDWLITPRIDMTGSTKVMSFNSMLRYDGTVMKVLYSENYVPGAVPSEFIWTEVPAATAALDSDTQSFDFVASGDIDLSALPDNLYIAFQYTSIGAGSGESAIARIDDFEIK